MQGMDESILELNLELKVLSFLQSNPSSTMCVPVYCWFDYYETAKRFFHKP